MKPSPLKASDFERRENAVTEIDRLAREIAVYGEIVTAFISIGNYTGMSFVLYQMRDSLIRALEARRVAVEDEPAAAPEPQPEEQERAA